MPAAAAAATAAIRLVQSGEGETRRALLWQRVDQAKNAVINAGRALPAVQSAILPMMIGDESEAVKLASVLRERGVFIPAIRYPTVARGEARLRITVTASHTKDDIAALQSTLVALPSASPILNPGT